MTRNTRLSFGLCMIAALILRVLNARGGLWLDEAWSVVLAGEAAPVVGVFASINHDNNHHLNTLWVQLLGPAAPPLALRALAIFSGVAT
ncbi:MAG: hypothetical protein H0X36_04455, partial [Sphingomonadaceae bacterium]|nr:hypothetical protein [Sphingomonadaceae bacterium]